MSEIVVKLFGEPKVTLDGTKVDLGSNDLSLLMVLVLSHGRSSLSVEELVTLLHPDGADAMEMDNVRSGRGRKAEPPGPSAIRKRKLSLFQKLKLELPKDAKPSATAQAITSHAWVDVVRFDEAMESRDLENLREAVQLRQRGPLGEPKEQTDDLFAFLDEERQNREKQFISVLRDQLIPEDRWNRPEQALDHVRLLLNIPGLSPNQENAFQRLRQELETTPAPPQSLPLMRSLPEMIGRRAEVEAIQRQLQTPGLVTLIGTGGIGKTRLALAVAGQPGEGVPHGVRFIDLTAVTGALLPQAVGQGLGLREEKGYAWEKMVLAYLQDKALLLVWDNCEQLAGDCTNLAREIITHCPSVRLLATSREPLGAPGEREYPVPVLPLPGPDEPQTPKVLMGHEATQLFAVRAKAVPPGFCVTEENSPSIFRICQGLDGLPLAIELAAALVDEYEPAWIAERLDNLFGLLVDGPRAGSLRHPSLQAAFDLSYGSLNRAEQKLFRHLGVFPGGFGIEAVEAVIPTATIPAPDVASLLPLLVRKSLVMAEQNGDGIRYRLLVTVRQYAENRLRERGEWEAARHKHRDFFLTQAEAMDISSGPEHQERLARLDARVDDLRAALAWCFDPAGGSSREAGEKGLRLAGALRLFWDKRGYFAEGRRWLETALAQSGESASPSVKAKALGALGPLVNFLGDHAAATALLEQGLALQRQMGDSNGAVISLNDLGLIALEQGDYAGAKALFEESLRLRLGIDDTRGRASLLNNLGLVAVGQGRIEEARELYQQSLALERRLGDSRASTLNNLAILSFRQGDHETARTLFEESLVLSRATGHTPAIASTLSNLSSVVHCQGDDAAAAAYLEESLALMRQTGERSGMADALNNLADLALHRGDHDPAWERYEESLALRRQIGDRQKIAYSLHNLGEVADAQGRVAEAAALFQESLTLLRELGDEYGLAFSLEGHASVAASSGRAAQAAHLWGAADALRKATPNPRPPNTEDAYQVKVAALRASLGDAAFESAWAEGRAMTWEQAAAFALGEDAS